jgi:3-oxoacyl-[acyl-carrier-protein] synthase III
MKSDRVKLESLKSHLQQDVDLFICCASYESRCRSVADQLPSQRVRHALVAETEHSKRYISENGAYLRARFADASIGITLNNLARIV